MSPCAQKVSAVLIGIGFGLLLSLLLSGWFVLALLGVVLVVLGCLLSGCA